MRQLVGDGLALAFDANNGYSVGGAIRVGRALEELGFWWFEEPVQHYHVKAMGEVARRLDITVSAGEQTYTLSGLADLIDAGVRMVQPDIVKMGGITGLMRCAALAQAHGVELVPHQTPSRRLATRPVCIWRRANCRRPSRASSTIPRRASTWCSKIRQSRSMACSACRPNRASVCGSTRRNWQSGAFRSDDPTLTNWRARAGGVRDKAARLTPDARHAAPWPASKCRSN